LTDLHQTLGAATGVLQATQGDLVEAKPGVLVAAKPLLASTSATMDDLGATVRVLNILLSDSRVDQLMSHLDSTTGHVDAISEDLQLMAHQLLHPDKVRLSSWGGFWLCMQKVHSMLPPLPDMDDFELDDDDDLRDARDAFYLPCCRRLARRTTLAALSRRRAFACVCQMGSTRGSPKGHGSCGGHPGAIGVGVSSLSSAEVLVPH
jgi:hypothetical protein